jgi:RimJ/RimL family protein N-acetyltransferase
MTAAPEHVGPLELRTARFLLRTIDQSFVTPEYLRWLREASDYINVKTPDDNQTLDDLRAYIAARTDRDDVLFLAIVDAASSRHIGNIKYEPVDAANGVAVMGILVGDPAFRGKGVAGEVLEATVAWLKARRGIHTIVLGVSVKNPAAIRAYEKVGFVLEDTPLVTKSHPDQVLMVRRV